jgi:hypothetical protein
MCRERGNNSLPVCYKVGRFMCVKVIIIIVLLYYSYYYIVILLVLYYIIIFIIITVGIAPGYGLDDQRGGSSSPGRVNNFYFSISSRQALGSTQPPIKWVPGALSQG